jgi:hypothetical protein
LPSPRDLLQTPLARLALKAALGMAVLLVIWLSLARGPGEPCHGNWDCLGLGSFCLRAAARAESYCSHPCTVAGDCPRRFRCEEVPVLPTGEYALELKRVCVAD